MPKGLGHKQRAAINFIAKYGPCNLNCIKGGGISKRTMQSLLYRDLIVRDRTNYEVNPNPNH